MIARLLKDKGGPGIRVGCARVKQRQPAAAYARWWLLDRLADSIAGRFCDKIAERWTSRIGSGDVRPVHRLSQELRAADYRAARRVGVEGPQAIRPREQDH
jgi:hypothetical protein